MSLCDQYLPDLSAWIDGELKDSQALEAHLATCASCRARAEEYRKLNAMIAAVEPPAALHRHIMQGVDNAHSPKAKRRFAFGSATAVAAAAAVLVLAIGSGWIPLAHRSDPGDAKSNTAMNYYSMQNSGVEAPALSPADANSEYREITTDVDEPTLWSAPNAANGVGENASDAAIEADMDAPAAVEALPEDGIADQPYGASSEKLTEDAVANFSIAYNSPTPDVSYEIVAGYSDDAQTNALDEDSSQILLWYIYDYQPDSLPAEFVQRFSFTPTEGGGFCADTDFDTLTTAYGEYYGLLGGDLYGKARAEAEEGETDQIILMPRYALTLSPGAEPASYWLIEGYTPGELPESFAGLEFTYTSTDFGSGYLWVAQISIEHFHLMLAAHDDSQVDGLLYDSEDAQTCYIILLPPDGWTEQLVWTLYGVSLSDLPDEILANCPNWEFHEDEARWSTTINANMVFWLYLQYGGQLGGELVFSSEGGESGTGVLNLYP